MAASRSVGETRTHFLPVATPGYPLRLSGGGTLSEVVLAYETYGELNTARDNAILLFHAMTGSQHAAGHNKHLPEVSSLWTEECHLGWWDAFIGPGKALDTNQHFILCANYLGGCYGSTGPASPNPSTGKPYGSSFPKISLADIVESQVRLLDHFQINRLHAVLGASIGGMLSLSFATLHPERVQLVIPIATGATTTPLQRLLNFEQAFAIESDPAFRGGDYYDGPFPSTGLAHARMIAHKTFVSLQTLDRRARRVVEPPPVEFKSYEVRDPLESYMLHQGRKFVQRFDANSYLRILEAWQRFDLPGQAGAASLHDLFKRCRHQSYLVFSIDSDVSFYPEEQAALVRALKRSKVPAIHITVHSEKGHDAFLTEPELFTPHLVYSLEGRL